jgi:hypothetical protein
MDDLRRKTRLNQGEIPKPEGCASYDCNGDGVVNVADYEGDSRVDLADPRRVGPPGVMTPQDLLIAFSDATDADGNGYVDDIVGWDFLDDDNDPYDDVQYGHGTGEAQGSAGESDSPEGGDVGSCPNCMVIHMRVGDSFIADVNRFAEAVIYATDNGAQVIQEALGTLNNSTHAREAVAYAYRHGVTTIASAADEAAQHNNWPSSLPGVILVNSVRNNQFSPPGDRSYLAFNGCTNFNAKITLAIPSTSCSSDATGVGAGMAGLVYSAAYNAFEAGALDPHPNCTLTGDGPDGDAEGPDTCVITANEVRQIMASGTIDPTPGTAEGAVPQSDDVDFLGVGGPKGPEPSCGAAPAPGCTSPAPQLELANAVFNRQPWGYPAFNSYPARDGHDQFYGYGRVNMYKAVSALVPDPADPTPAESRVPPEVEISSPEWYQQVDPARPSLEIRGDVYARGEPFTCEVLVAPGHYPNNAEAPTGDFHPVPAAGLCDGTTSHTAALSGELAELPIGTLKSYFPPDASAGLASDFTGREPGAGVQTSSGRPNTDPYGFVVKVVASTTYAGATMTGEDRRAAFLHRDQDMLDGFPKAITGGGEIASPPGTPTSDGESSPAFADLDGDNDNELVFGTTDGFVHALRPDGSELPGWPVRTDVPGFVAAHTGSDAYGGEVSSNLGGAILGSVAIGDTNRDGLPEIYAADLEGKLYGWSHAGERIFTEEANPAYSGAPLAPFENVREGETNRTQHGFIASPVLADLDLNDGGRLEIVAAGMDRHVYAWERDGSMMSGFPILVVDPEKVDSVDPQTHQVTFKPDSGALQQGAIIATPAVGDLDGDANNVDADELPEIVVGTNEEYDADADGGLNAGPPNGSSMTLLDAARARVSQLNDQIQQHCDDCPDVDVPISPGNSRLYALSAQGDGNANPLPDNAIRNGDWPARIGILNTELLPVVGEGISGYPVIAPYACSPGLPDAPKVGVLANNGPVYVLGPNGASCYGRALGRDVPLQSDFSVNEDQFDRPVIGAVGHPAFGELVGGEQVLAAPAAGLLRALDVALPEYQRSQDFLAAWSVTGNGQFQPGYPAPVNDLQFLTGPSIADIDGQPGEEIVAGTASKDLAAFNALGLPADERWPKLSTDWTVANPLIGSFGTLDTEADANKVVVGMTRSGYINAYETDAPACSPGSWPRFHHDNANSGDTRRDAVLPGRPFETEVSGGELRFLAPGDELLCGTADRYEAVTSDSPIDESNFDAAAPLEGEPEPQEAGTHQSWAPPAEAGRYVAIRAVDEQGNVGRIALFDFRGEPPSGGGQGGAEGGGPADGAPADGGPAGGGPAGGGEGERLAPPPAACSNPVRGTARDDELVGTPGSDRINGRGGDDLIGARRGDDCASGGPGRDRLRGGGGDDLLDAADARPDLVRCGAGSDRAVVDADDIASGCERVRLSRG